MSGEVIVLPAVTTLDTFAERVLAAAIEADLERAVVIGRTRDGELYFASSAADGGKVLWDIEQAKKQLLEIGH